MAHRLQRNAPGWPLPLLLGLLACGPADPSEPPIRSNGQPIVNGTTDQGDPAVVALTIWGQMFCSGTLITQNVVMTAAHCLPPNISEITNSYTSIDVFFGTYVGDGAFIAVVDGWTHPQWDENEYSYDIGLVRLAGPGPATPIPFNTQSLSGDTGKTVRLVGFGQTSENATNSAGTKRQATTTIADVYPDVFLTDQNPGNTCFGDSGGPTFMDKGSGEVVIGIHSRSDCVSGADDTNVDYWEDEINTFLGNIPQANCNADGQCATGCPAPDPDCPCAQDGFCTLECPEWWNDPDCNGDCVQNGVCITEGCPEPDPDCGGCVADGICDPNCPDDPDCSEGCAADGFCNETCPTGDPDCWVAGDAPNQSYEGGSLGSCQLTDAVDRTPPTWLWLWALALAGAALRIRLRRA